jgi:hypothetical protein
LLIEPSPLVNCLPLEPIQHARHTNNLAASMCIFMSASLNAMAWFSMMARPNALRSLAYSSAYS